MVPGPRLATIFACALSLLAGCTAPRPTDGDAATGGESSGASLVGRTTFPMSGKISAAIAPTPGQGVDPLDSQDPPDELSIPVHAGAVAIVAELAWGDASFDLDLALDAPGCDSAPACSTRVEGGTTLEGDTPVRLVVQAANLKEGTWTLRVTAKSALDTDFLAAATVFYGLPPAKTFSALTLPPGWPGTAA